MQIVSCNAPLGPLEPAPLTSLFLLPGCEVRRAESATKAFWGADDEYYVRVTGESALANSGDAWYSIAGDKPDVDSPHLDPAEIEALGRQLSDVIPLRAGKVAFPIGLGGKSVYRMWRTKTSDESGSENSRIRIQAVRAGRSLRRLA